MTRSLYTTIAPGICFSISGILDSYVKKKSHSTGFTKHFCVNRPVELSVWSTFSRNESRTDLTFGSDSSRPVAFAWPEAEYASAMATTSQLAERAQSVAWPFTAPQFATSVLPGARSAQFLPATARRSTNVRALGSLL